MKKLNLFLFITILLLSTQKIFAYDFYTKEIHKGFLYKENIELHILNKYGNVTVIPVQQDSITLDIKVSVEHYEEDKANKLLDEIDFKFSKYNNTAKSETVISNHFKTGLKFRVDYIVRMPAKVKLNIKNNFGDIFLEGKINEKTKIDLNYGNLVANEIVGIDSTAKHIIKLNYSSAKINVCDNLKLTSNYSKIKIGESKQVIVASNFSKVELVSNDYIIANCNRDTYDINYTSSANILKGTKSNITINNLKNSADINLEEGNIKVVTENGFNTINIKTKNVKTDIITGSSTPYYFQVNSVNTTISYPENAKIITSEKDSFNDTEILKGIIGEENNITSSINITSKEGSVNIK